MRKNAVKVTFMMDERLKAELLVAAAREKISMNEFVLGAVRMRIHRMHIDNRDKRLMEHAVSRLTESVSDEVERRLRNKARRENR